MTPGSAVRHASVARHVNDCATRPGKEGEMPFNIFANGGPAEEVFGHTENVNSDLIICKI